MCVAVIQCGFVRVLPLCRGFLVCCGFLGQFALVPGELCGLLWWWCVCLGGLDSVLNPSSLALAESFGVLHE